MSLESWQTLWNVCAFLGVVMAGAGSLGAYLVGQRVSAQQDREAAGKEAALNEKVETLLAGNRDLRDQLGPFLALASQKYPGANQEEALAKLRADLVAAVQRATALEQRVAPRLVTEEQAKAALAVFAAVPKAKVSINAVMGDQEAHQFAQSLLSILRSSGWEVDGVNQVVFSGPVQGTLISVGRTPPPEAAQHLFRALQAAGVQAKENRLCSRICRRPRGYWVFDESFQGHPQNRLGWSGLQAAPA